MGSQQSTPKHIVSGGDWPHVMVKTAIPNDGDVTNLLSNWITPRTLDL